MRCDACAPTIQPLPARTSAHRAWNGWWVNPRFEGRTAVVTGAASGIGSEITRLLMEEGARVLGADVDAANVPAGASPFKADVSDATDVNSMIAAAIEEFGHIDILCNNA